MLKPSLQDALRALVIAILIALLCYLILLTGTWQPSVMLTVASSAVSALLAGILVQLRFAPQSDNATSATPVTLFVGNLAFRTTPEELQTLFAPFGPIHSLRIMKDRMTRRPRGFAFVELDGKQAARAISKLHDSEFNGRKLRVNESTKSAGGQDQA